MSDIVERLRAACNGHPHAKIEWPHRVLHEAADEIERSDAMDLEYLAKNAPGIDIEVYTPSTDKIVSSGEMRNPIYITRGDFRAARTALDAVKER